MRHPALLTDSHHADYLILVAPSLYHSESLRRFADWRSEYSGLDVAIVSLEEVAASFAESAQGADTHIRRFIQYAYEHWTAPHRPDGRLRYVLLVGDAELLPIHIAGPNGFDEHIATDNWYACMDEDDPLPDILIGRFPAKNERELTIMLTKTIQYERAPIYGDWANNVLLLLGSSEWAQGQPDHLRDTYWLPAGYQVNDIRHREGGDGPDVLQALNRGQHIVYYTGHGETHRWELLQDTDVPMLRNQGRLPVIFNMACYTGRFDHPEREALGEVFLKFPAGAVAFFGASRLVALNRTIGVALAESLTEENITTLGEVVQRIKRAMMPNAIDVQSYNLLGDPALDLGAPRRRPGKADLVLSPLRIEMDAEWPRQGEEVVIQITVQNTGDAAAQEVRLDMFDHASAPLSLMMDRQIHTQMIGEIPARSERIAEVRWRLPLGEPGHQVRFHVQTADTGREHYTANNDAIFEIPVSLETPGWPVMVEETTLSAPMTADVDGDGFGELLMQSALPGNNQLYVWRYDGQPLPGWPQGLGSTSRFGGGRPPWHWDHRCDAEAKLSPSRRPRRFHRAPYYSNPSVGPAPAVGDLDGDGKAEIVATSFSKEVYAWSHDGSPLPGWPVQTAGYATSSPVLADVNDDGRLEVVVGLSNGEVAIYRSDGSLLIETSFASDGEGHVLPLIVDLDGDGSPEIFAFHVPVSQQADATLYAWNLEGVPLPGWPREIPAPQTPVPPVAADLDGDGTVEMLTIGREHLYVWEAAGTSAPGWPVPLDKGVPSALALGDIDGDGDVEITACASGGVVYSWHHDGRSVFGWPIRLDPSTYGTSAPVLADVDGDHALEVVLTSGRGQVHAHESDGTPTLGWPAEIPAASILSPALATDLNGDGRLELGFAQASNRQVHLLSLRGREIAGPTWTMLQHDAMHTGSLPTGEILPLPPPAVTARDASVDTAGNIVLSWALSPQDRDLAGYVVSRAESRDGDYTVIGQTNRGEATYIDHALSPGLTYWYVVRASDGRHLSSAFNPVSATAMPANVAAAPSRTSLGQNYPNPLNPETWIPYELAEGSDVVVRIYDVQGHLLRTIPVGYQPAGRYIQPERAAHWDGRNQSGERVANGYYFYTLQAGEFFGTRKMLIRK